MLMKDGKIAVIESKRSKSFMLPGGKIESGEDEKEALKREVLEELGIDIEDEKIEGPFLKIESKYQSKDDDGNEIYKIATTKFYIANTENDINPEKMSLTEREKKRGSVPHWVNPSVLEYALTEQKGNYPNAYARRYAEEYLSVYHKFLEYQKRRKDNEFEK